MKNKKTDFEQEKSIYENKGEDALKQQIQTIAESDEQKGALVPDIQIIVEPDTNPQPATDPQPQTDPEPTPDTQPETTPEPESSGTDSSK